MIKLVAYCPARRYQVACTDKRCHARHDRKLRLCAASPLRMAMACVIPLDHPVSLAAAVHRQNMRMQASLAGER